MDEQKAKISSILPVKTAGEEADLKKLFGLGKFFQMPKPMKVSTPDSSEKVPLTKITSGRYFQFKDNQIEEIFPKLDETS